MNKQRVVILALGLTCLFSLGVSSARADSIHFGQFPENSRNAEPQDLNGIDLSKYDGGSYLYDGQSSDKKSGFSAAAMHHGPRIGLVGHNPSPSAVTPTPEPLTITLLATGLVGIVGSRRKRTSN